jgi:PTS system cellobiose-specific IIB component
MLTVAIVCGAGASSTFLARRLSDIAQSAGFSFRFVPHPLDSVTVDTADLVALTSHVVSDEVTTDLTSRGIAHITLPTTVRGGFGADDALAAIAEFFGNNGQESEAILSSAESKEN